MTAPVLKPPLVYYGGKTNLADRIADLLPPHEHYVEPFCGSLSVLLAKSPSRMETVNDLDHAVMTFWRMLRDRPLDLERACAFTPHSRAEYLAATHNSDHLLALRPSAHLHLLRAANPTQTPSHTEDPMTIDCPHHDDCRAWNCPHHDDCRAWTGDERRRDGDTYQWECSTGLIWWADQTGYWNDDEPTR